MRLDADALEQTLPTARASASRCCWPSRCSAPPNTAPSIRSMRVVDARDRWRARGLGFGVHVDGAWGGYLATLFRNRRRQPAHARRSAPRLSRTSRSPKSTPRSPRSARTDSITVDPHKLGYLPYGAGAFVCRDHRAMALLAEDADYVFHDARRRGLPGALPAPGPVHSRKAPSPAPPPPRSTSPTRCCRWTTRTSACCRGRRCSRPKPSTRARSAFARETRRRRACAGAVRARQQPGVPGAESASATATSRAPTRSCARLHDELRCDPEPAAAAQAVLRLDDHAAAGGAGRGRDAAASCARSASTRPRSARRDDGDRLRDPAPHADEPVPDRPRERHQLHRPVLRATSPRRVRALLGAPACRMPRHAPLPRGPDARGDDARAGSRRRCCSCGRKPRARPTPTCCGWTSRASPASTSTSRTRPRIRPAASSTGSRARCSCTRCATAACDEGQTVVDASSGSTAISEAWFARLLGLPFVAVMPACTAPRKIADVQALGGHCDLVDDPAAGARARGLARRARRLPPRPVRPGRTRHRLARQQQHRRIDPRPAGAANPIRNRRGSSAAPAPAAPRRRSAATCAIAACARGCASPNRPAARSRTAGARAIATRARRQPTLIEGIGRPRVEPGFLFEVVDDGDRGAGRGVDRRAHGCCEDLLGRRYGGSSGTNLVACLQLAARMRARGERGSIVSLLCDRGERYDQTLFDAPWLARQGLDPAPWRARLQAVVQDGRWHGAESPEFRQRLAAGVRPGTGPAIAPERRLFRTPRSSKPGSSNCRAYSCSAWRSVASAARSFGFAFSACAPCRSAPRIGCSAASARLEPAVRDDERNIAFDAVASCIACCGPMCPCS